MNVPETQPTASCVLRKPEGKRQLVGGVVGLEGCWGTPAPCPSRTRTHLPTQQSPGEPQPPRAPALLCREELRCRWDGATADRQITATPRRGCKNRLRIDMESCPKQQDAALNLLIKPLKFSHPRACRCQRAAADGSASSPAPAWLRDSPAPCQGHGSKSSPRFAPSAQATL